MSRKVNQAYTQEWFCKHLDLNLESTSMVMDWTPYRFISLQPKTSYVGALALPGSIIYTNGNSTNIRLLQVDPTTYEWNKTMVEYPLDKEYSVYFVLWDPSTKKIVIKG